MMILNEATSDQRKRTREDRSQAFTLIELLVSMAILALLTVLIAQIAGVTSNAINTSSKKLSGMAQARFALDRLGADLLARVNRSDVDQNFQKLAGGNDQLSFFSEVESVGGDRQVSTLSYRIQETATDRKFQLERGVVGTSYDSGAELSFLPATIPAPADADYDVLADGVLRLEFCYLKKEGTLSISAQHDLSDVSAVIVAVAVLDPKSRKILKDADLKDIADALPDAEDGKTPREVWEEAMKGSSFAAGVPPQGRQALRLYERYYYLN